MSHQTCTHFHTYTCTYIYAHHRPPAMGLSVRAAKSCNYSVVIQRAVTSTGNHLRSRLSVLAVSWVSSGPPYLRPRIQRSRHGDGLADRVLALHRSAQSLPLMPAVGRPEAQLRQTARKACAAGGRHWLCDAPSQLVAQMARRITSTSPDTADAGWCMPERLELAKRWALRPSLAPFLRCLAPGECACGSGLGRW